MSENYGDCSFCGGKGETTIGDAILLKKIQECPCCDGTGMSGDADVYRSSQQILDDIAQMGNEILRTPERERTG